MITDGRRFPAESRWDPRQQPNRTDTKLARVGFWPGVFDRMGEWEGTAVVTRHHSETMGFFTTIETAVRLGVRPSTLRAWDEQYAFPGSCQGQDGHRRFDPTDVDALGEALAAGLEGSQAIRRARGIARAMRRERAGATLRAVSPPCAG
jgi:hypothetical protein